MEQLRARLQLAAQIDKVDHQQSKESHDAAWLQNLASEGGLDIDSDDAKELGLFDNNADADVDGQGGKRKQKQARGKAAALRSELDGLLQLPLQIRGVSRKYLTSGGVGVDLVNDLLENRHVDNMVGVRQVALHETLQSGASAPKKAQQRKRAKAL